MKTNLSDMTTKELRELQNEIITELKSRKNTRTAAVVFVIHVGTPDWIAQMFITHVPNDVSANELKYMLDEAGYWFGEFGTRWANHYVTIGLSDEPASVRNAYKNGYVNTITYDELVKKAAEIEEIN